MIHLKEERGSKACALAFLFYFDQGMWPLPSREAWFVSHGFWKFGCPRLQAVSESSEFMTDGRSVHLLIANALVLQLGGIWCEAHARHWKGLFSDWDMSGTMCLLFGLVEGQRC